MKTRALITCLLLTGCSGAEFTSAQEALDSTSLPHDDGGSVREPDAGTGGTYAGGSGGERGAGGAHAGGSGGSSVDRDAGAGGSGSAGAYAGDSGGGALGTGGSGSGGAETGSGGAQATGGAGGAETGGTTSSGGSGGQAAAGGAGGTGALVKITCPSGSVSLECPPCPGNFPCCVGGAAVCGCIGVGFVCVR
jgi:hypothetical protein